MRKPRNIIARVPDDLILKVREVEGWPRIEGDKLATIRRMNEVYDVTKSGDHYIATRKVPHDPR